MVELILKLPRTEKFNIGQEYKTSMYEMLRQITYLNKIDLSERLPVLNRIDAELNAQRIFLRIMKKNKYIDNKKFDFETQFIYTTYACIKGRGMHKATLDVQKVMKHCKSIWGEYYILKMDIAKYFQNINKEILLKILKRKVKDEKLLNLIKIIIYSTKSEKGIPIGNYTSQLFANIYLNEADKYLCGHIGYMKIANVKNLQEKYFIVK